MMADPAIVGVIGTSIGALVGYLGAATQAMITAKTTRKREEIARLFDERKRVYAEFITNFTEMELVVTAGYPDLDLVDPAGHYNQISKRVRDSQSELKLLAPSEVRQTGQACREAMIEIVKACSEVELQRGKLKRLLDRYRDTESAIPTGSREYLAPIILREHAHLFEGKAEVYLPAAVVEIAERRVSDFRGYARGQARFDAAEQSFSEALHNSAESMRRDLKIVDH